MAKVLLTGGAGFIGSHTAVEFLEAGVEVVVADNYSNSYPEALNRVEQITGKRVARYECDVCDKEATRKIFEEHRLDAVVHFAGYKAVGESVAKPIEYYRNNINSALVICELMREFDVKGIVFSSSATVYGKSEDVPFKEDAPTGGCTNPYGWTKFMIEQIISDFASATPGVSATLLRYFNPVGAHPSGQIGEDPNGIPNNLAPYVCQVAVGKLPELRVFGADYATPDGTGVRDFIHVVDLAKGHVAAFHHMQSGVHVYNLGTGRGYSVFDMIKTFERVNGVKIPYRVVERRPGDVAQSYADPSLANKELEWNAALGLDDMCRDAYNWQRKNPNGYRN